MNTPATDPDEPGEYTSAPSETHPQDDGDD
jgi:hypothetical protein